ncbi:MAG: type II toxin-antitoxin system VapC family toxin [Runella sp.]
MKYLLDTNVFVMLVDQDFELLSQSQKHILSNAKNEFLVSEASIYELAIKVRKNKFSFKKYTFEDAFTKVRKKFGIVLLKTNGKHYSQIRNVEQVIKTDGKPHADPFDLLIISQATTEKVPVISTDSYFPY